MVDFRKDRISIRAKSAIRYRAVASAEEGRNRNQTVSSSKQRSNYSFGLFIQQISPSGLGGGFQPLDLELVQLKEHYYSSGRNSEGVLLF